MVIDKGEIAEMGTHDELIAHNGVYKRLVLRQLTAGSFKESLNIEKDQDFENTQLWWHGFLFVNFFLSVTLSGF